jgi:hypothetical protein
MAKNSSKPMPAPKRVSRLFLVDAALLEQVRDAVAHLAGHPAHLSMRDFVDAAFRAELRRLQRSHNGGKPFPPAPKRG